MTDRRVGERTDYNAMDVVKFIMSLFIVILHTEPFKGLNGLVNEIVTNGITRLAVPFFFICSGFLIEGKAKDKGYTEYKRKSFGLIKLYVIWSILYFIWPLYNSIIPHEKGIIYGLFGWIKNSILCGSYGQLWYFKASAVALFCIYLAKKIRINEKLLLIIGLVLYLLGLLNQSANYVLNLISAKLPVINLIDMLYRKLFSTTRNGIFFGLIFTIIGMCIASRNIDDIKKHSSLIKVGTIISIGLLLMESLLTVKSALNRDMYVMLIPATVSVFLLVLCIEDKFKKLNSARLRYYSTVIYCCHFGIYDILKLIISDIRNEIPIANLILCITTILLSIGAGKILIILSEKNVKIKRSLSFIGL